VDYSIADFAKSLIADNCKIQNRPDLLFLCGGPIAREGAYRSARDFFNRHLRREKSDWTSRIKLSEDVNAWFRLAWSRGDPAFRDLLELENYLAYLAAVTVLFVESPGSIAELGAFAASEELRPKTLAVLNTKYGVDRSFIADGPVLKISNENEKHVLYYTWDPTQPDSLDTKKEFGEMAQALTLFLEQEAAEREKQLSFDSKQTDHTLLLVADLIRIAGVVSKADLTACLKALDCDPAQKALDRLLSILQSVDFVAERRRSNQTFYVRDSSMAFIRYAYREDARLKDAQRIQTAVRQSLEPIKKAVLRKFLAKEDSNA
jgi:hypothetical protein